MWVYGQKAQQCDVKKKKKHKKKQGKEGKMKEKERRSLVFLHSFVFLTQV